MKICLHDLSTDHAPAHRGAPDALARPRAGGNLVRATGLIPGLIAAALSPAWAQAMPQDGSLPAAQATAPAHRSADPGPLDLRLPPSAVRLTPLVATASAASPHRQLRLEPRKSLLERGVEGSREALIACQNGAYPGATVASSGTKVSAGDAQPDHCYRF